jgi:hypothetical protein
VLVSLILPPTLKRASNCGQLALPAVCQFSQLVLSLAQPGPFQEPDMIAVVMSACTAASLGVSFWITKRPTKRQPMSPADP